MRARSFLFMVFCFSLSVFPHKLTGQEDRDIYNSSFDYIAAIKGLVKDGVLDSTHYDLPQFFNGNKRVDFAHHVRDHHYGDLGFNFMNAEDILRSLERHDMITKSVRQILEDRVNPWDSLTSDMRYDVFYTAVEKDHLENLSSKLTLIKNLKYLGYFDADVDVDSMRLFAANFSYENILDQTKYLKALETGFTFSSSGMKKAFNDFFALALSPESIPFTIDFDEKEAHINVGKERYTLLLESFKRRVYDDYYSDQTIRYNDTIFLDEEFYTPLNLKLKQIFADNNVNLACSVLRITPPFNNHLGHWHLKQVVDLYPYLSTEFDGLYLNTFKKEEYDFFEFPGTSYLIQNDNIHTLQIDFQLKCGDKDAFIPYITSQQKRDFMNLAVENPVGLKMSVENRKELGKVIFDNLYKSGYDLIKLFDDVHLEFSRYFAIKKVPDEKPFKEIYSNINDFFNGQCSDWTIVNKPNSLGVVVSTPNGTFEARTMSQLLNRALNELGVSSFRAYKGEVPGSYSEYYFILNEDQVRVLEEIFGPYMF